MIGHEAKRYKAMNTCISPKQKLNSGKTVWLWVIETPSDQILGFMQAFNKTLKHWKRY